MQLSVWESLWLDTHKSLPQRYGSAKSHHADALRLFTELTGFNITCKKTFPLNSAKSAATQAHCHYLIVPRQTKTHVKVVMKPFILGASVKQN